MKKTLLSSLACFVLALNGHGQQLYNVSANSATICFANSEQQTLNIRLKSANQTDTTLFFCDFDSLPRYGSSMPFGGINTALSLPLSYTGYNDCRAKNIFSQSDSKCYFFSQNAQWQTPLLPIGNNNIRIHFDATNSALSNKTISISLIDSAENQSQVASIIIKKNTTIIYDTLINIEAGNFRVNTTGLEGISIDNFKLSCPSIINTPEQNFSTNDTVITFQSLKPNTLYKTYIEGRVDTLTFNTLNSIAIDSISQITTSTALIHWHNQSQNQPIKIIVKQKSMPSTILAKDLFFSEYVLTSNPTNKALEIYNGTGKPICLKDYSIKYSLFIGSESLIPIDTTFYFGSKDTLQNNRCVVITENLPSLNNTKGIFYRNFDLKGFYTMTANDAVALIKNGQYIDIIGSIGYNPSDATGWTATIQGTQIEMSNSILRRKSSISCGVKTNPMNCFPTLALQWDYISHTSANIQTAISTLGSHTMNNNSEQTAVDNTIFCTTIAQGQDSLLVTNLCEGTLYEVSISFAADSNNIVKSTLFSTSVNTQRLASGQWNDSLWSKGEPTINDNAIVSSGQSIIIPQNTNATCQKLIIYDSIPYYNAQIKVLGTLNPEKPTEIHYNFGKQSTTQYTLFGLPAMDSESYKSNINSCFALLPNTDSIFELSLNGSFVYVTDSFENSNAYLVKTQGNSNTTFFSPLNNEQSYSLLSGAQRGYYMLSNPYPFFISKANIESYNISKPQILDSLTFNFRPLNTVEEIAPFESFLVYVNDTNNYLFINKDTLPQVQDTILNHLTLVINGQTQSDSTRLVFAQEASNNYNILTDNLHIKGLGLAPEIYFIIDSTKYYTKAIQPLQDSIIINIDVLTKQNGTYKIKTDTLLSEPCSEISLYDKATNALLCNLLSTNEYTFSSPGALNPKHWLLKIKKSVSNLENIEKQSNNIQISQHKNKIEVQSTNKIISLALINTKGQTVTSNKDLSIITIPCKGVFFLRIESVKGITYTKVVNIF